MVLGIREMGGTDRHLVGTRHGDLLGGAWVGEFPRVVKHISLQDCLCMFEVLLGFPGILCCGVSFPGHQVLPSALCPTMGQDPVQFELFFSANKVPRRI
jgi:hypothetical protein